MSNDTSTRRHSIAVIAGDGIGTEVVPLATEVIDAAGVRHGFTVDWTPYPWGSEYYREHGTMMPSDGLDQLAQHDAVFFGAVGAPDIPDHVTLWGLLIPIRRGFQQCVNLRPVRHVPGVSSPLANPEGTDMVIVRENVEGEYSEVGGRFGRGTDAELAVQEAIFTRQGTTRVARYAAELAATRRGQLTSATKSNGIIHSMPFWDEVVAQTVAEQPGVELRSLLIDAFAAAMVTRPQQFDVVVASNLFGDILSDLAAACVGSIGLAASGNLNPERRYPSMFEPVHGSAPDIAGRGIANPVGQIATGALMLDFLGETTAASGINRAIDTVLRDGPRTRDIGGTDDTRNVSDAIRDKIADAAVDIQA
ncbi:tartrate dehydrogenase [Phycicoccus sp. Soil802]|uniref:tartrate dehydrogenase n=1 Tax=Phycicoccus sp. Soil802 TaxID=1736414 RepID=UPI0007033EC1|nr:tartrate dehydrogenase [Phycicoccus sp. Soil802]KRF22487.1 tartrate dehydrogenase [Phycicoccus sp. Soil802]